MAILNRVRTAWNAFRQNESPGADDWVTWGPPSYPVASPSRPRRLFVNERTIIASIYNRICIDVADVSFRHVQQDDEDRFQDVIQSPLNDCLTFEPNLDQGPRAFRQDIAMTLCDKGVAAIVPVDTSLDPNSNEVVDIYTLRVGEVVAWYPKRVTLNVYNEEKGLREHITLDKRFVAIVENPLYSVMNEPNSTLQRLIRKLGMLDSVDEATSSGKLDLIIQLPYVIKTDARRQQAEQRRKDIEFQLKGSQYGIAYADGTEKITQLNRPAENNLLAQIEYLTKLLYSQLGITEEVMNGTADEKAMINYFNRTVEPMVDSIMEAMQRSFLGPVRTKNKERILYFRDPFKLVPVSQLAEIADKFTRNEITTGNEMRGAIGLIPSKDPKADLLRNSNMPVSDTQIPGQDPTMPAPSGASPAGPSVDDMSSIMNQVFDGLSSDITSIIGKTNGTG